MQNIIIKYFLILTIIQFIMANFLFAQDNNNINKIEFLSQENLNDVKFFDNNNGVICGDNGTILITNNNGLTWGKVESNTNLNLNSIYCVNNNIAFIVGGNYDQYSSELKGIILKTIDIGKTWDILQNLPNEAPNYVYFFNENIGFIVGKADYLPSNYKGLIKKTTDSGKTWVNLNSGTYKPLNTVQFIDANIGYSVGDGISLKTIDGGESWIDQTAGPNYFWPNLYDLYFNDVNNGFEFGGAILKTSDGGNNWSFISEEKAFLGFKKVKFFNEMNSIAVGNYGLINTSSDGGMTWGKITTNIRYYVVYSG